MYGFVIKREDIQSEKEVFREVNSINDGMNECLASASMSDIRMPSTSYSADNTRVKFPRLNFSVHELNNKEYYQHGPTLSKMYEEEDNSIDEFDIDEITKISLDEFVDISYEQLAVSSPKLYSAEDYSIDEFDVDRIGNISIDEFFERAYPQHTVSTNQKGCVINKNFATCQQQIADLPPQRYIRVVRESSKFFEKFKITLKLIDFKVDDSENGNNPEEWFVNVFSELLARSLKGCQHEDYVSIRIHNSNLPERPLGISVRKVFQCNSQMVMDALTNILQSNESFFTCDLLTMFVTLIPLPSGGGNPVNLVGTPAEDFCVIKKHSFIYVHSDDNMCLARCLILAIAYKTQTTAELKSLRNNETLLTDKALELCSNVGIGRDTVCNYEHIKLFQNYLQKFTIRVYNSRDGSTTVFEGPISDDRVVLNLYLENNHYSVIKSLTGAFSAPFFCENCKKRYFQKTCHRTCPYKCPCCFSRPQCPPSVNKIICNTCNRDFRGQNCFNNHKKDSICSKLHKCLNCFKCIWISNKDHKCGYAYCSICLTQKPIRHLCFMGAGTRPKYEKIKFVYIFYDLECTQDPRDDRGYFELKSIVCAAQNVCNLCVDDDDISQDCSLCGRRQHIFKENPVKEFLGYVSSSFRKHKVFVIAHNMKGYDCTFVLREIMKNVEAWSPKIISDGTKLMSITCGNIKFMDSLNFIPLPLSQLPGTFGFDEMKSYFPYLFNKSCNENYVGPLPNFEFYAPDDMSVSERKYFFIWYNYCSNNNFIFNMKTEIENYCISDVNILRKACLKFRQALLSNANLDPFFEAESIDGVCNLVFRRTFLKENTIAVIPPKGYRIRENQSIAALKWLLYMELKLNERFQYTGVEREFRLPEGILVDGYIDSTKTVLEFNSCYFHGCRKCFNYLNVVIDIPENSRNLNQSHHMFQRYEATIAKQQKIQSLGYNLISIWECEFNDFLKNNPDLNNYLDQQFSQYQNPLNPRDAFYGGRTSAVKLHHSVNTEENEEIHYYSICSLYPYVNKYKKYPVGHPKIHIGDECSNIDLNTVEGIVKCSVLPPQNLYHPVLPYRCNGKLTFPLCCTCVENLQQNECDHTNEQRSFTGTFVVDELRKAIELKYTVLKIFEVWEYKVIQYNAEKNEGGLFAGYIDKFLKLKQENSGWPSNCNNEEEKNKYIEEYFEKEGIKLDSDKISKNSCFRYLAELMLNNFWGKFGQSENMTQTSIISNPDELYKTITDPSKNTKSFLLVDDECIVLNWNSIEESVFPLGTVNVAIAAYTTAFARLVLYEYLEKLGERVIYFDTDSVFVTKKPGEWTPETGDFLGMMKNELETYGKNSYITDFLSTGPKSYSYKVFSPETNNTETVCKVKGITLSYKHSQAINFDSMKEEVLGKFSTIVSFNDRKMVRRADYQVVFEPESKKYTLKFNKRQRLPDCFDSVPYGFKLNV